jgi:hypothetical protein
MFAFCRFIHAAANQNITISTAHIPVSFLAFLVTLITLIPLVTLIPTFGRHAADWGIGYHVGNGHTSISQNLQRRHMWPHQILKRVA